MASAGIDLHVDALHAGAAIHLGCALDARTAIPHRVLCAGDKEEGQRVGNARDKLGIGRVRHQRRQRVVGAHGELLAAQGIATILIDHLGIGCDPIDVRPRALDRLAICSRAHAVDQLADVSLSARTGDTAGQGLARRRERARLLTGAANHRGANAKGVPRKVDARDKAAHRMSKNHIRKISGRTAVLAQSPHDKFA